MVKMLIDFNKQEMYKIKKLKHHFELDNRTDTVRKIVRMFEDG